MREDKGGGGGGGEEERVMERKRRERRAFIHLGVTNVALGPSVNHRHSPRFSASHLVIGVCHRVRVVDHDHPSTRCRKALCLIRATHGDRDAALLVLRILNSISPLPAKIYTKLNGTHGSVGKVVEFRRRIISSLAP